MGKSKRIKPEDYSLDAYATMGGLDELHETLGRIGFQVKSFSFYIRLYQNGKYCGTGKITKIGDDYVPMVFIFRNAYHSMDSARYDTGIEYGGGLIRNKYRMLAIYGRRIVHPKGRIYGFKPMDKMTEVDVETWKEIAAECMVD